MISALHMGKLIYKNTKNKWHMIKADPRSAWHMINSSAPDLKADEEAIAKVPNANMQHQQTEPNLPKNPKVAPLILSEDDLIKKKYRFSVKSHEVMLSDKLDETAYDLFKITYELFGIRLIMDPKNMLTKLDTIIEMVSTSFHKISSTSIDCVEEDDSVTKEDDDSVVDQLMNKLSRKVNLINKLCEASGDIFKIYHKLLNIRKDVLTKTVSLQEMLTELSTITGMVFKSIRKIGYQNFSKGGYRFCVEEKDDDEW